MGLTSELFTDIEALPKTPEAEEKWREKLKEQKTAQNKETKKSANTFKTMEQLKAASRGSSNAMDHIEGDITKERNQAPTNTFDNEKPRYEVDDLIVEDESGLELGIIDQMMM